MASTAVSAVLRKLSDLAGQEVVMLWGVEEQIVLLRDTFQWLQAFLKDADQKRREKKNESIRVWVDQIRDAAYDVEDLLDEFSLKLDLKSLGYTSWRACIKCFAPTQLVDRHNLGDRIRKIGPRLEKIAANKSHFIQPDEAWSSGSSSSNSLLALRYEMEEDVVGLDEDAKNLKQQLMDPSYSQRIVISIVGMGGLGKTTLANKVYKDQTIINYFDYRIWVFVSQTQNIKSLLRTILKDVAGLLQNETATMEKQEMTNKILEHLKNKTYLIVLDDIWDTTIWDGLKAAFPLELTKSRVLLTTRKMEVARHANPDSHPYEMRLLSSEETWKLFCKKAFQNANCPEHLQSLQRDILQRCNGLPLATVVLGGLLRRKAYVNDSYNEWVKELKLISVGSREEDQIKRILSLSYDDLPHHLKPCFLYFTAFRDDSDIYALDLKHMWVAEGFIQHDYQGLTMEEIADSYLRELIERCMIQLKKRDVDGSIEYVRIHDFLLDLARSEAKDVNFLQIHDDSKDGCPPTPSILRRLSLHNGVQNYAWNLNSGSISKLRSLILMLPYRVDLEKRFELHGVILLRVIDLQNLVMDSLPHEIEQMVHLRFLNLRFTKLKMLPSTISNLHHLQTVNLIGTEITKVPNAFWKIQSLRHVFFDIDYFRSMPKLVSNLNDLQTLDWVPCGSWMRENGLEKLKNLRTLSLHHVSVSDEESLLRALSKLEHLSFLGLMGDSLSARIFNVFDNYQLQTLFLWGPLGNRHRDPMLKSHHLLPNLKKLSLWQSNLVQNDLVMLAALPNLKYLDLLDASEERELTFSCGWFPCLEKLILARMFELHIWAVEDGVMPCLTSLVIAGCDNLRMLPDEMRHLSTLKVLKIAEMPLIQKRMEKDTGEDYAKIQHVESIFYHETFHLDMIY